MNTMARRELEDWIVAECYRVASGAAAPAGWIEPRGMRDGDWYCFEHSGAHERSIFLSEILLNYFRLEPSGPYIPGSRSNECFADSAASARRRLNAGRLLPAWWLKACWSMRRREDTVWPHPGST